MARRPDGGKNRRADLADADLRPLPRFRRICRQQQPFDFDLRGAGARGCGADSRQRMRKAARAQYRDQHVGPGRPRPGAPRERAGQAFVDPRRSALSPRGQAVGRAEPWQPCRRTGNVADAGAGAASGRHDARRSQPRVETGDAGRIDAVGPEFTELQPLRQLWRSDTGDIGQGRSLARRHARRSPRTGRRVHRARAAQHRSAAVQSVLR